MSLVHRKRIIPVLLLHQDGLVKSKKFKDYTYLGDPINAVKIFNEKEVDEIIILDIDASKKGYEPKYDIIEDITGEAFMPLAYGGGINHIAQAEKLFFNGVEKVVINTALLKSEGKSLLQALSSQYGTQSVVASIDVRYNIWGKPVVFSHATVKVGESDPVTFAKRTEDMGAGELFLNVVDRDGTYKGYDLALLKKISEAVEIPVIMCGGASDMSDFEKAEQHGASAMAAGSMFVFRRPHNAVLISYI